jgi:hypothetical protein
MLVKWLFVYAPFERVVPINSSFHTTFVEAICLEEKENLLISDHKFSPSTN